MAGEARKTAERYKIIGWALILGSMLGTVGWVNDHYPSVWLIAFAAAIGGLFEKKTERASAAIRSIAQQDSANEGGEK